MNGIFEKIGTNHIISGVISCAIFSSFQYFAGVINMFSGWSLFSKLVASQFRDYIVFPQGYSYSQPSFVFWCFAFFSVYFCIAFIVIGVRSLFTKQPDKTDKTDLPNPNPYAGCGIICAIVIPIVILYCGFTLSKTYYANSLYKEYCISDLTVQEKNPADSLPFKIRLSKADTIDEIRSIIDEMKTK